MLIRLEYRDLGGRMTVSKVLAPPYAHPNSSGGGAGVSKPLAGSPP